MDQNPTHIIYRRFFHNFRFFFFFCRCTRQHKLIYETGGQCTGQRSGIKLCGVFFFTLFIIYCHYFYDLSIIEPIATDVLTFLTILYKCLLLLLFFLIDFGHLSFLNSVFSLIFVDGICLSHYISEAIKDAQNVLPIIIFFLMDTHLLFFSNYEQHSLSRVIFTQK